jgi:hypothetical protein
MIQNPDISIHTLTGICPSMAAAEIRRLQQREQTLEWISTNALSTFRSAWCGAKLNSNGYAPGSGTSAQ